MVFRSALGLALALIALSAEAQSITTLEQLTFQPTILAAKGVVTSCGIRFSGLAIQPGTKTGVDVVDGSIAIHSQGYTLVKAGFKTGDLVAGAEKLQLSGKKVAWVRIEGGKSLSPMENKIIDADDPGFHMFGSPLADGMAALDGLLSDKKFWIGFSGATGQDKIFSGATLAFHGGMRDSSWLITISPRARAASANCWATICTAWISCARSRSREVSRRFKMRLLTIWGKRHGKRRAECGPT